MLTIRSKARSGVIDTNWRRPVWLPCTMTRLFGFAKMVAMQTVVIMATVAIAGAQLMWRVVRPPKQPAFVRDWTADE